MEADEAAMGGVLVHQRSTTRDEGPIFDENHNIVGLHAHGTACHTL
jgi:hypothetical protein